MPDADQEMAPETDQETPSPRKVELDCCCIADEFASCGYTITQPDPLAWTPRRPGDLHVWLLHHRKDHRVWPLPHRKDRGSTPSRLSNLHVRLLPRRKRPPPKSPHQRRKRLLRRRRPRKALPDCLRQRSRRPRSLLLRLMVSSPARQESPASETRSSEHVTPAPEIESPSGSAEEENTESLFFPRGDDHHLHDAGSQNHHPDLLPADEGSRAAGDGATRRGAAVALWPRTRLRRRPRRRRLCR